MRLNPGERYTPGVSLIHRLDARVKVVTALLLIGGVVATPAGALRAYPLLWTLIASLGVIGGIGVWRLARLGGVALPFALAGAALLFTTPGTPIFSVLGARVSDAGLLRFLDVMIKSWLAVQVGLLLTLTTPLPDLLGALAGLRVPAALIAITGFMLRYLTTLKDEAERLLRARSARSGSLPGQTSGGSLFWRGQVAGGVVGSLFLRSFERSERVYAAMLARGYDGQMRPDADAPPLVWRSAALGAVPVLVMLLIQLVVRQGAHL